MPDHPAYVQKSLLCVFLSLLSLIWMVPKPVHFPSVTISHLPFLSSPNHLYFTSYSVQFSSITQSCLTLCHPMDYSTPGFPVHHQLPELTQTHIHWVGDAIQHLILCHPFLLLPSIFPSIRVFSSESVLQMRWPKYWSFSFSVSPSNEYSLLISFRADWFDLPAVQGTLKSLLQHHSSKASILWRSTFFIVHLTPIHDYWKSHSFD